MGLKRRLQDPLIHFLAIGAAIFAIYALVQPEDRRDYDANLIIVDRPALLEFIQYRSKRFDPGTAEARLDAMNETELQQLVSDYVREEALYREAKALGLHTNDYVIKRRMVQTLEFVAGETAGARQPADSVTLKNWYQEHQENYLEPAAVTFTHVFLSRQGEGQEALEKKAVKLLADLQARTVSFDAAGRYGDRFIYQRNYVDRTESDVAGHFGTQFAGSVFDAAKADQTGRWIGPVKSAYGLHLVLVSRFSPERMPTFDQVRSKIAADYAAEHQQEQREAVIEDVLDQYEVEVRVEGPGALRKAER